MVRKLYPNGKQKAFQVSYDDGVLQDIRFVELLNKYGLKGTFNLNSGLMEQGFAWTHESGSVIRRLSPQAAAGLYDGHEIASHTRTHPYLDTMTGEEILAEMVEDKKALEEIFHRSVFGFAVPFTWYSGLVAECARKAGFEYARISEESHSFRIPEDFYWWRPGKFHWAEDLERFVHVFLMTNRELAVCQIVGHSYDLDLGGMWERMEALLQKISRAEDVISMTHLELVRYLRAMDRAVITETEIRNESAASLWFQVDGKAIRLYPGDVYSLEKGELL